MSTIQTISPASIPLLDDGLQAAIEPAVFRRFACLGAACQDTCCHGMSVAVDEATFELYQEVQEEQLRSSLAEFIKIQPAPTSNDFARIQLKDATCPLLHQNLCSVQTQLGESFLSKTCRAYPRQYSSGEGLTGVPFHQRSLHLSCPEAARLVLGSEQPMSFQGSSDNAPVSQPDPVRGFVVDLLQNRTYSVSDRLLLVGHFTDQLAKVLESGESVPELLEGFALAVQASLFNAHLKRRSAVASDQLALVLELIVIRIGLDYTAPNMLDLYRRAALALQITETASLSDIAALFQYAQRTWFQPFLRRHEYILENYLVHYAFSNQLPWGSAAVTKTMPAGSITEKLRNNFVIAATYFAICKLMIVAIAAEKGLASQLLTAEEAIQVIQVCSRALEHCTTFPASVVSLLQSKNLCHITGAAMLTQDLNALGQAASL